MVERRREDAVEKIGKIFYLFLKYVSVCLGSEKGSIVLENKLPQRIKAIVCGICPIFHVHDRYAS